MTVVESMHPASRLESRRIVHELANSIRERDLITYEHSRRVATYAQRVARQLGWARLPAHDLALSALVHDLGKTWIVNEVLFKDSALSSDERVDMERHPGIGARMLEVYGAADFIVAAVRHHHEAYDGRGYPDRLVGAAIPLAARILSVADVFDALTSERSYKAALTCAEACERLSSGAGTYFDPEVVEALLRCVGRWPAFVLPRAACPLTPPPALRRNIWLDDTHDLVDL